MMIYRLRAEYLFRYSVTTFGTLTLSETSTLQTLQLYTLISYATLAHIYSHTFLPSSTSQPVERIPGSNSSSINSKRQKKKTHTWLAKCLGKHIQLRGSRQGTTTKSELKLRKKREENRTEPIISWTFLARVKQHFQFMCIPYYMPFLLSQHSCLVGLWRLRYHHHSHRHRHASNALHSCKNVCLYMVAFKIHALKLNVKCASIFKCIYATCVYDERALYILCIVNARLYVRFTFGTCKLSLLISTDLHFPVVL